MHQMKFEDKRKALEELGVSFAKPKHPEFSLVAKRYGSFSEWRYHQSPDSLARAGFYYTGKQIKRTNSYKIKRTSCVMKELKEIYEQDMIVIFNLESKTHQTMFHLKLWRC